MHVHICTYIHGLRSERSQACDIPLDFPHSSGGDRSMENPKPTLNLGYVVRLCLRTNKLLWSRRGRDAGQLLSVSSPAQNTSNDATNGQGEGQSSKRYCLGYGRKEPYRDGVRGQFHHTESRYKANGTDLGGRQGHHCFDCFPSQGRGQECGMII